MKRERLLRRRSKPRRDQGFTYHYRPKTKPGELSRDMQHILGVRTMKGFLRMDLEDKRAPLRVLKNASELYFFQVPKPHVNEGYKNVAVLNWQQMVLVQEKLKYILSHAIEFEGDDDKDGLGVK